jgi:general secretion pathway protein H
MRTSATGRDERRRSGFTLVELLIVLTILGIMSAAVILALPDSRGSLAAEGERFAARAAAAQERAVLDSRAVAIRVTGTGYGFDRRIKGEWEALNAEPFVDRAWGEGVSASVGPQGGQRIIFDSTGGAEPFSLVLAREDERVTIAIGPDGNVDVAR